MFERSKSNPHRTTSNNNAASSMRSSKATIYGFIWLYICFLNIKRPGRASCLCVRAFIICPFLFDLFCSCLHKDAPICFGPALTFKSDIQTNTTLLCACNMTKVRNRKNIASWPAAIDSETRGPCCCRHSSLAVKIHAFSPVFVRLFS